MTPRGSPRGPSPILRPQDKSPPRARGAGSTLARALLWLRRQLSPLEAPTLLWGLMLTVGAIRAMQALLGPRPSRWSPPAREQRPAPKDSAGDPATPARDSRSGGSQAPRRRK